MWSRLLILSLCSFLVISALNEGCLLIPDKYDRAAMLSRNVIYGSEHLWPGGNVYYKFDGVSTAHQALIKAGMKHIEDRSCVKFTLRKSQSNYVNIKSSGQGCVTTGIGYSATRGASTINLDTTICMVNHLIVHELLHALGFFHEQQRPDRDTHIRIIWKNVIEDIPHFMQFARNKYLNEQIPECDFTKLTPYTNCHNGYTTTTYGFAYDYQSVMHYTRGVFSKDGLDTMSPTVATGSLGNLIGLTDGDVDKLNAAYSCPVTPLENCSDKKKSKECTLQSGHCKSVHVRKLCPKTCGACN